MGSLDSSSLPASTSPDLALLPSSPAERIECAKLNSSSWAGTLSNPQYMHREDHLVQQPLTANGQSTNWILTDKNLPPDSRPILSACETLRKIGYVVRDGKIEEVVCHGVGSVFCKPDYRGRGYAGRMMHELGKNLEHWQQEGKQGTFSILWSDIGKKFYAAYGWKAYPSTHIAFSPIEEEVYHQTREALELPSPSDLTAKDLEKKICPEDVENMRNHLKELASANPHKTFIAVRPDYHHMSWHHAREEFQNSVQANPEIPEIKGSTVSLGLSSNTSLLWTRVYGSSKEDQVLNAIRLAIPPEDSSSEPEQQIKAIAALLLRAQLEASRWAMGKFEIWSPDSRTVEAAQLLRQYEGKMGKVIVEEREKDSICSLRFVGQGQGNGGEVEWIANEKYAWC